MKPSILIPAYNEAAVIARTLSTLTEELQPGEAQIIVICNGCSDRTAEEARTVKYEGIRVLERAEASKTGALNAGEEMASGFPRVYLDADIQLSSSDLRLLLERLSQDDLLAAEPIPSFRTDRSTLPVRIYYRVWQALHGREPGRIGSGLVGVNQQGRARFDRFPEVIADDAFLRRQFQPGELVHVAGATSIVQAPRTLGDLVKIKARSRRGTLLLEKQFPDLVATGPRLEARLGHVPIQLWAWIPIYAALTLWIRLQARRAIARGSSGWERDTSSREGSPEAQ